MADQLRLINNNATPAAQVPTVGLEEHFKDVELTDSDTRRAWSIKQNYKEMLDLFILPR